MPCQHTEESQSPPDIGQFQGRQDQEKEALSSHRRVSSSSSTQGPLAPCAGGTAHLPCALNASDDTQVHSCPASHQAEEQLPLDSAWVADVRCDIQSLPVPEVAHSATALAFLHKSWSQEHCHWQATGFGDSPCHDSSISQELQAPAWQALQS